MEKIRDKKKRQINKGIILTTVLSVLLLTSLTVVGTLAWFASQDSADQILGLGGPVIISITDSNANDTNTLKMEIAGDRLLPGMLITPDIAVTLSATRTATILRARLDVSVAQGSGGGDVGELNTSFKDILESKINNGWSLSADGWYYHLGNSDTECRVMITPAETSALTAPVFGDTIADYGAPLSGPRFWEGTEDSTVLASIISDGSVAVDFLTEAFRLPTTITNDFATQDITVSFHVEALQDYLIVNDTNVLPSLENARVIFEDITTFVPEP